MQRGGVERGECAGNGRMIEPEAARLIFETERKKGGKQGKGRENDLQCMTLEQRLRNNLSEYCDEGGGQHCADRARKHSSEVNGVQAVDKDVAEEEGAEEKVAVLADGHNLFCVFGVVLHACCGIGASAGLDDDFQTNQIQTHQTKSQP